MFMESAKLKRITDLTNRYMAGALSEEEKLELAELQREWLLEQSPQDINVQRSVN